MELKQSAAVPSAAVLVLTAAGSEEDAVRIGKVLVEEKLAACVNVVPGVRSLFYWKGALCDEREWLLIVKSRGTLVNALKTRIRSLHPYEIPEVISVAIENGEDRYIAWILESTQPTRAQGKKG